MAKSHKMETENIELQDVDFASVRRIRFDVDVNVEQNPSRAAESERASASSSQISERRSPVERSFEFAEQKDISFSLPEDPAPNGSECLLYLTRNITCFSKEGSKEGLLLSFYGELRGERELLLLNFTLTRKVGGDHFDLKITDVTRPFESHLSLARFQQAEVLLQFIKPGKEGATIVHEEPAFQVSLDFPHWKRASLSGWKEFLREHQRTFSVFCSNVVPVDKLLETVEKHGNRHRIVMRIYLKLIEGQLDVLHGIQKCFHSDKSLYNLRDVLAESLVSAEDTDMIWISGDNKGYKLHRSILSANSEFFKIMFRSGLSESKSGVMHTPSFINGVVLEKLLKFLYARNRKDLENDPSLTMSVLRAANFYQMNLLAEVCEESLLAMPIELFSLESCLPIFQIAELLDRQAIETKIVHILMRMDVKLSSSEAYIEFIREAPIAAAKMTEMILQFKDAKK